MLSLSNWTLFAGAEQVSSLLWLLHSDLQDAKENAAVEYMSSIVATVEGLSQSGDGQRGNTDTKKAKLHVRSKRRNGRVKLMVMLLQFFLLPLICEVLWYVAIFNLNHPILFLQSEEIHVEQSQITFTPLSSEDDSVVRNLVPKVSHIYMKLLFWHLYSS